jgi:hypothetical protein
MKKEFMIFLLFGLLVFPKSSWALFEARLSYGSLASKQSLSEICQGSCGNPNNAPSIVPTVGMGVDAIVKLPLIPFGFGIRTEDMKLSAEANGIGAEIKYNRKAVLINYRLIDTIVHFGPIASFGISHSGSAKLTENGTSVVDISPEKTSSYTVGLELLVKPLIVIPITIGAEAGYMSYKWGQSTNTVDSSTKDIDLSGNYMKVFLGLDF